VGENGGTAKIAGASLLHAAECAAGRRRLRSICRRPVRQVLRTGDGTAEPRTGRYFRLLLVGYFEGIDSERGMANDGSSNLSSYDQAAPSGSFANCLGEHRLDEPDLAFWTFTPRG
jgi:hypothetical protein